MTAYLGGTPALLAAARIARLPGSPLVLVDGRSGSGKTSFADALAAATGVAILRLEDLYPGWDGLEAGARALAALLIARRGGAPVVARCWDWIAGSRGAAFLVPPGPLVVEGCGSLSRATARYADLGIWLDLPDDERRHRALERDGDTFAPHWERWARQERRLLAREAPRTLADLIVLPTA